MECKHNTADGCEAYPHRMKCIGKVCECFVPEEDYQAYIDELHKQVEEMQALIDSYIEEVTYLTERLEKYEDALLNLALK